MAEVKKLMDQVAGYEDQIIEIMKQIVAIPALGPTNGGQGELAKAEYVEELAAGWGLNLERVDAPDERVESGIRPNLVATYPGGDGPKVWVLAHLDVVPPGPVADWGGDPWQLRVEGEKLIGRGANDNNGGLLASLFGLKALMDLDITPKGQVGLIMVADEETGSAYGLDYVLKKRPDLFSPEDMIIVPDAGNDEGTLIEVAEKSVLWLKVVVSGKQVHGSTPQKGVNALYSAARMMVAVREVAARFPATDELFSPPFSTFEPTRTEAGVPNINTVPGRHEFYIDCRVLPSNDLQAVLDDFTETFEAIAAQEGAGVEITAEQFLPAPPPTAADAPVVLALKEAIKDVKGLESYAGGIGGGTVAAFFRQRGLPAVSLGLGCY
jgi:succinyl-diaminopimelate desuccinylase